MVKNISRIIADLNGNWLDSHLAEIAGYFGGLIHVTVAAEKAENLAEALKKVEGIDVLLKPGEEEPKHPDSPELRLELVGNDRPGIVRHVTEAIASHGANLLELKTEYSSAPMSGQEIFKAEARIQLPPESSLTALQSDLETIASDLMVDIRVEP